MIGCGRAYTDIDECRAGWTTSPTLMRAWGREGLAFADTYMTRLAGLLRARDIPLTVVVYPWPQHLALSDRHSIQVAYWQTWATREHVTFVDLFEPFFDRVSTAGLERTIATYFIPDDSHWNAVGHALVASEFLAHPRAAPHALAGP